VGENVGSHVEDGDIDGKELLVGLCEGDFEGNEEIDGDTDGENEVVGFNDGTWDNDGDMLREGETDGTFDNVGGMLGGSEGKEEGAWVLKDGAPDGDLDGASDGHPRPNTPDVSVPIKPPPSKLPPS
jgi:hypothetical protein